MASNIPSNQHSISLEKAIAMTTLYRENREKILKEEYTGKNILPLSETFNKDAFTSFFANPLVKALRIYYGMSEDLLTHAIIVGVNEQNQDILPIEIQASIIGGGTNDGSDDPTDQPVILEDSSRCPPICDDSSPLNEP